MSASAKSIVSSACQAAELVRRREPVQIILRPASQTGKGELVVLGVYADGSLPARGAVVRCGVGWCLEELAKQAGLPSKVGETLLLYYASGEATRRVLLLGLGPRKEFDKAYLKALGAAAHVLASSSTQDIDLPLPDDR